MSYNSRQYRPPANQRRQPRLNSRYVEMELELAAEIECMLYFYDEWREMTESDWLEAEPAISAAENRRDERRWQQ
jgi:hypothetical protein